MGHTRWATHGGISVRNCHPQMDCSGGVAVVHNGIIENYQELKAELLARRHSFSSETDTEIIPHYIEELMRRGTANQRGYSVRAVAYIAAGHERHHGNIIRERYLPGLKKQ